MKNIVAFTLFAITLLSCSSDDNDDNTDDANSNACDFETIVSADRFANDPADALVINNLTI